MIAMISVIALVLDPAAMLHWYKLINWLAACLDTNEIDTFSLTGSQI